MSQLKSTEQMFLCVVLIAQGEKTVEEMKLEMIHEPHFLNLSIPNSIETKRLWQHRRIIDMTKQYFSAEFCDQHAQIYFNSNTSFAIES